MKTRYLFLTALLMTLAVPQLFAGNKAANPGVSPPQANFQGNSYGDWHVAWWQWADSFTNAESPVWQRDGVVDTSNQSGKVWFLAGYFGNWFLESDPVIFTRQITVPSGKALFFPILNGELTPREWQWNWILANYPDAQAWADDNPDKNIEDAIVELGVVGLPDPTVDDLWDLIDTWFADPTLVDTMSASIDGKPLKNLGASRAPSPEAYTTSFPATDNHMMFFYPNGGDAEPVVADGWCLLVEPLSVGRHTIKFKANFGGTLGMDITYQITVAPAGKAK